MRCLWHQKLIYSMYIAPVFFFSPFSQWVRLHLSTTNTYHTYVSTYLAAGGCYHRETSQSNQAIGLLSTHCCHSFIIIMLLLLLLLLLFNLLYIYIYICAVFVYKLQCIPTITLFSAEKEKKKKIDF